MGNSNSELKDSSSQSDSGSYYSDTADTEIDIERYVPQKSMFLFFKKFYKTSQKSEQKKKLLI